MSARGKKEKNNSDNSFWNSTSNKLVIPQCTDKSTNGSLSIECNCIANFQKTWRQIWLHLIVNWRRVVLTYKWRIQKKTKTKNKRRKRSNFEKNRMLSFFFFFLINDRPCWITSMWCACNKYDRTKEERERKGERRREEMYIHGESIFFPMPVFSLFFSCSSLLLLPRLLLLLLLLRILRILDDW